jgi:hypothetical protein
MNDTERDLRELFESKAREAGGAPPVSREVLRRGRRRQLGTVAIAGVTALAVAAAAVVSLQALHRADDRVPGGSTGNPAFTATIQNFTLTVPKGWTLIDQWPLGASMAVDSTSTKFSCVGQAVAAGSGKNIQQASGTSDCPDQQTQTQTPEPPTIPEGGLPMLTLSNDDPGLGGSVCNAGGPLPASSATLYIGLDYGLTRTAGWDSAVPAWPAPLQNVLEGDVPPEQMPCGAGGYSRFQAGGVPYIAWAGFGSEVTDADRQAIVDAFNGMQVNDGEISGPADETPGYVLSGGTRDAGPNWSIEARLLAAAVDMGYREPDGRSSDVSDITVPDVAIEIGGANDVIFGAVTFDADRVELRPRDGSSPIPGTILHLPDSLNAPFDAFVLPNAVPGEVVAIGSDGDLGSSSVGGFAPTPAEPTESSVDLQGFASTARLTVRRDNGNGCLSIEIATGDNEGAGFCGGGPTQPVSAEMVALSDGEGAVLGYAAPEADQVYLVSDNGRRFDAPILYTLDVEPSVRFFAFSVPVTSGLLHVTDVNGVELRSPIPLNSAP